MPLQRQRDIESIILRCSVLRNVIESSSALNLTSLNVVAEYFFRDLLNLLLDVNLKNLNDDLGNTAAIDLGDKNGKICVQVTATPDKPKIKNTVQKFVEHDLHNNYVKLVIFIATKKKKYQSDHIEDGDAIYSLDLKKDVWDWTDIYKKAQALDANKLSELREFVERNIVIEPPKAPVKEVGTFIDLMQILSDETHSEAGKGILPEPDPDKKIEKRFSEHATFLLDQYGLLYEEYGAVLEATLAQGNLGAARMRRLGLHLATKSNHLLCQCDNNPKQALDALVSFYLNALQESGKNSDEGAIQFFMLDQMIRCHVFPNESGNDG